MHRACTIAADSMLLCFSSRLLVLIAHLESGQKLLVVDASVGVERQSSDKLLYLRRGEWSGWLTEHVVHGGKRARELLRRDRPMSIYVVAAQRLREQDVV